MLLYLREGTKKNLQMEFKIYFSHFDNLTKITTAINFLMRMYYFKEIQCEVVHNRKQGLEESLRNEYINISNLNAKVTDKQKCDVFSLIFLFCLFFRSNTMIPQGEFTNY